MTTVDIFLQTVSVGISCISTLVSLVLLILFARYLWLKHFNRYTFETQHVFGPPSIHLLYYLMVSSQFITSSQYYIFALQYRSSIVWESYCKQYDGDITHCDLDEHCSLKSDNSCGKEPSELHYVFIAWWFAWIFVAGIHSIFYCFPVYLGENCIQWKVLWKSISEYKKWKDDYYQLKFFSCRPVSRTICDFWWWSNFICFYPMTLTFCLMFNGPNIKYIEWYTFLSLFILSISNEVIKHYIYRSHQYKEEDFIFHLLTNKFGKAISNLIWTVYANQNEPIRELQKERIKDMNNKKNKTNHRELRINLQSKKDKRRKVKRQKYEAVSLADNELIQQIKPSRYNKDQRIRITRYKKHSHPTTTSTFYEHESSQYHPSYNNNRNHPRSSHTSRNERYRTSFV
eukprot:292814_1